MKSYERKRQAPMAEISTLMPEHLLRSARQSTWGTRGAQGPVCWDTPRAAAAHASAVRCDTQNPPQGPSPDPLASVSVQPTGSRAPPAGLCECPDAVISKNHLFLEKNARIFILKVGIRKQRSATAVLPNHTFILVF